MGRRGERLYRGGRGMTPVEVKNLKYLADPVPTSGSERFEMIEDLQKEVEEQARLLGMSSEREASLLAKNETLRKLLRYAWSQRKECTCNECASFGNRIAAEIGTSVQYGCHCDLEPHQKPDDCVIDRGDYDDCIYATKGMKKEDCKYWGKI